MSSNESPPLAMILGVLAFGVFSAYIGFVFLSAAAQSKSWGSLCLFSLSLLSSGFASACLLGIANVFHHGLFYTEEEEDRILLKVYNFRDIVFGLGAIGLVIGLIWGIIQ